MALSKQNNYCINKEAVWRWPCSTSKNISALDVFCVFPMSDSVVYVLIQLLFSKASLSDPGTRTAAADGFFY